MGLEDFWSKLNNYNNGQINSPINIKKENIDEKFYSLFDKLDGNNNGILEGSEISDISTNYAKFETEADFANFSLQVAKLSETQIKEASEKETAIDIIDKNISEAEIIFNSQELGAISDAYDKNKGEDNKLATSNVRKVLDYQKSGEIQLIKAKDKTLTRRAYYEENKQRLKDMILTRLNVLETPSGIKLIDEIRGKYSRKELEKLVELEIEHMLFNAEIDKIKDIQKQFVSFSTTDEIEVLKNFSKSAINNAKYNKPTQIQGEGKAINLNFNKGIIPTYWDSAEPIEFEEVYKLERGVEYSPYNISKYNQAKAEFDTILSAYNKKEQFVSFTKQLREETIPSEEKLQKPLDGFKNFYYVLEDEGRSKIQELIDKSNLEITLDENGINLSKFETEEEKINALNKLLKIAQEEKEKEFKTFLGDKTIEDYQKTYEESANAVLGEDNCKLLTEAMKNDNLTAIQRYTGNVSMAGMGLTLVGGALCFTPLAPLGAGLIGVGNAIAIGGMVAKTGLGVADYSTKTVKNQEELEGLAKDFIMDAGGFIIGMKAGQMGMKAFNKLIDKKLVEVFKTEINAGNRFKALKEVFSKPEYIKSFATAGGAKLSTDFLISYVGDLAMMGVLDTKDDWKSLLQANAIGLVTSLSGDIKSVTKANVKTKTTVSETSSTNSSRNPLTFNADNIRKLVDNNPELKNNPWVKENLDKLIEDCKDTNNDNSDYITNVADKIRHPLLKNHRFEILETFLSDPALYSNPTLQKALMPQYGSGILNSRYNKQDCKQYLESLKLYSKLEEYHDNPNVQKVLNSIITNWSISTEQKEKLFPFIAEANFKGNNFATYASIASNLSSNDNLSIIKEICDNPALGPLTALHFCENHGNQTRADIEAKLEMYEIYKNNPNGNIDNYRLSIINRHNIEFAKQFYNDKNINIEDYENILRWLEDHNKDFLNDLMNDKDFPINLIAPLLNNTKTRNIDFVRNELYPNKEIAPKDIVAITHEIDIWNRPFARTLINDKSFPNELIAPLLKNYELRTKEFAHTLYNDKNIPREDIADILDRCALENLQNARKEVYQKLSQDKDFPKEHISKILIAIKDNDNFEVKGKDFALKLCENYKDMEIPPEKIAFLIENHEKITPKQFNTLRNTIGIKNINKLSDSDLFIACQVPQLFNKKNINEIPIEGKKEMLRSLVACNQGLFNISPEMKKMFPILPTDKDTYCSLLPAIVRSLGIETNTLTKPQIENFNHSMNDLATNIAKLNDTDFANLNIRQEYSKDDFIQTVLEKVKDLSSTERQKVYDYFGFELHKNRKSQTGFSITGYPVNLNNGKKLAQITDPNTKAVIENLRGDVIRFSEQNPVKCDNPKVEKLLNEVVEVLPELRTCIGKTQHRNNGTKDSHDFDVFKHSLKVMQKVAQDPKFKTLNESDQKLMMLASLLHDITKTEGRSDKTHSSESSFDAFFIAKKFNLTKEEEIKLFTLTRHHEWLEYVNTAKTAEEETKRLQSAAYDLRHDNLLDMALIFTHADLRAVKIDDSFHDTAVGKSRMGLDGTSRSYGESTDIYAQRLRGYIEELKTSQPMLPQTKVPKADIINSRITVVNPDGSTNLKGVYKNKDGLVIIKFNEVTDWEALGFPPGTSSRGIKTKTQNSKTEFENVDTGNMKFIVHGLDFENQLAKFDAFSLIDSDILLSVSYAERPESKFRFFRPQGVLLDVDTKYIHGGGNTDAGSGCGKFISDFKKDYIFGGKRENDRVYIPNLIKEATGMNDAEYIKFVQENENKSLAEIEPKETREQIIKAFATINSNIRKGKREYNEMYASNPNEVTAVFAYNMDYTEAIGNPITFLSRTTINDNEKHSYGKNTPRSVQERTQFLQEYALEHNLPFIIFGN